FPSLESHMRCLVSTPLPSVVMYAMIPCLDHDTFLEERSVAKCRVVREQTHCAQPDRRSSSILSFNAWSMRMVGSLKSSSTSSESISQCRLKIECFEE